GKMSSMAWCGWWWHRPTATRERLTRCLDGCWRNAPRSALPSSDGTGCSTASTRSTPTFVPAGGSPDRSPLLDRRAGAHIGAMSQVIPPLGRVVATELKPSTPHQFHFWTARDGPIGIGAIVRVEDA